MALPAEPRLQLTEIGYHFYQLSPRQALGQAAGKAASSEKVGAFLVLPDPTEGDGTRTIAPMLFGTNGIPAGIHRYTQTSQTLLEALLDLFHFSKSQKNPSEQRTIATDRHNGKNQTDRTSIDRWQSPTQTAGNRQGTKEQPADRRRWLAAVRHVI